MLDKLGRRAVLAASYLDSEITPLPVLGDERAKQRLEQVLSVATRGVRRDMRRYRLALYALGRPLPLWLRPRR